MIERERQVRDVLSLSGFAGVVKADSAEEGELEVFGVGEPWFWNEMCTTSVAGLPWRPRGDNIRPPTPPERQKRY